MPIFSSMRRLIISAGAVEHGVDDLQFPAEILHRRSLLGPLQGADGLLFAVFALSHDDFLVRTATMPKFQVSVVKF